MHIKQVTLRNADVGFRIPFAQSSNIRTRSGGLIFEVLTRDGVTGYGESLPRDYVTGETVGGVAAWVRQIPGHLFQRGFYRCQDIADWIGEIRSAMAGQGPPSNCACCGLELALLDALGKTKGRRVLDLLGGARIHEIYYSGVIGAGMLGPESPVLALLDQYRFREIKLKVGRDAAADAAAVRVLRQTLGPEPGLRVDANGAWSHKEALTRIRGFLDQGIQDFEQPLAQKEGYPALLAALPARARIWVDDSLCTPADAQWFIANGAAGGFNLKVSKNGGLFGCLGLIRLARDNGIPCQLGAQVGETSLITAAGQVLAFADGGLTFHEGGFGQYLLKQDIAVPSLGFGRRGRADVTGISRAPGMGIRVLPDRVAGFHLLWQGDF